VISSSPSCAPGASSATPGRSAPVGPLPRGGLQLWARLPAGADDQSVAERARAAGVIVSAGRGWFPADPPAAHLRLSFGGASEAALAEGAGRLAAAAPELTSA
jgi:DNA-binding transcriptional MocR family regulator